jgi:CDP-glucose 4,6-dehydratase
VVEVFSARFSGRPGWRREAAAQPKEAAALTLSSNLAHEALDWRPRLNVGESLSWTADWYRAHAAGENMKQYSEAQISQYQSLPALIS